MFIDVNGKREFCDQICGKCWVKILFTLEFSFNLFTFDILLCTMNQGLARIDRVSQTHLTTEHFFPWIYFQPLRSIKQDQAFVLKDKEIVIIMIE